MFPEKDKFNVTKNKLRYSNFVTDSWSRVPEVPIDEEETPPSSPKGGSGIPPGYVWLQGSPPKTPDVPAAVILPLFPDYAKMDCNELLSAIKFITKKRNSLEIKNKGAYFIEAYENTLVSANQSYQSKGCSVPVPNNEPATVVENAISNIKETIYPVFEIAKSKIPWLWIMFGIGGLALIYILVPGKKEA